MRTVLLSVAICWLAIQQAPGPRQSGEIPQYLDSPARGLRTRKDLSGGDGLSSVRLDYW